MMKKFIKDNRGQVLYAVIIAVMFVGMLSMTAMGLTLKNYQSAVKKQQHVRDYYAADAIAELIRIKALPVDLTDNVPAEIDAETYGEADNQSTSIVTVTKKDDTYTIESATATIVAEIDVDNKQFKSWEVSYHAVETEQEPDQPS